jgi:hypothetical protein
MLPGRKFWFKQAGPGCFPTEVFHSPVFNNYCKDHNNVIFFYLAESGILSLQ